MELRTDRFLLREFKQSDIERVYDGLSNPAVIEYYGVSFDSLEATQEQMRWFGEPEQKWFAISSVGDDTFCGAAGLNDISSTHRKAEIGLWLLPEFWGQGIMTEVMPLICDYGFNELNLHRIEGFIDSLNKKCKRAMAKLDFEFEGLMKDCEIKNGKFISLEVHAKLNEKD